MSALESLPSLGEIDQITREIHVLEARAMGQAQSAVLAKAEIGQRLIRAKEIMNRGDFVPWAEKEFGWSRRHVYNHISLAQNVQRVAQLPPGASLRAALGAITEPKAPTEPVIRRRFLIVADEGEFLEFNWPIESQQATFFQRIIDEGRNVRLTGGAE